MTFENPLKEADLGFRAAQSCVMVIFGATGDLTARKLVPALYNLAIEGQLPPHFACVGFARRDKSHEEFRSEMEHAVSEFSRHKPIDKKLWESFKEQIFYHKSEFDNDAGYESLKPFLKDLDEKFGTEGNRVYYLATPPKFFPGIIEKLGQHGLIYKEDAPFSRVIIEKPFGHDLASAKALQKEITSHLDENQIFRIDHFLGKETVQNLLVLRFSNPIFESIWNNKHVDHVQLTVSEDLGIGTRGNLFEESGLLRDIIQNHMMQLLSLIAMEPPNSLLASAIHDEKVKVLESIRPFPKGKEETMIVRGQYGPGFIEGKPVPGYREEKNVSETSNVETFAAMKLMIDNWRWAGVPFYMRAGKRLPKKVTEISIAFRDVPGFLFKNTVDPNLLVIRIQPNEGISLKMNCKVPGISSPIQPVKMDFRYGSYFGESPPEAYERLICDCMSGDSTLFARIDEVIASWVLFSDVLHKWEKTKEDNFPNYQAGTFGPKSADRLMEGTRRKWRLL